MWIPAGHLRQGDANERLGNHDAARFHYGRARAMWRDAEPEFVRSWHELELVWRTLPQPLGNNPSQK